MEEAFDGARLEEIKKLDEKLTFELSKLESEKEILEMQKAAAMSAFDIAYALKLDEKIQKVKADSAKAQAEADKQNAEIAKAEQEYLAKKAERKAGNEKQDAKFEANYEIAKSYIDTMTKENAFRYLENNPALKEKLGYTYSKLLAITSQGRVRICGLKF